MSDRDSRKPVIPPPNVRAQTEIPSRPPSDVPEEIEAETTGEIERLLTPTPVPGSVRTIPDGIAISRTESDEDVMQRQVKETRGLALKGTKAATTTLNLVESLRKDTKADVKTINERIDQHGRELEKQGKELVKLGTGLETVNSELGHQRGQNVELLKQSGTMLTILQKKQELEVEEEVTALSIKKKRAMTDLEREQSDNATAHAADLARTELDKQRALALIDGERKEKDDAFAAKAARREVRKAWMIKAAGVLGLLASGGALTQLLSRCG